MSIAQLDEKFNQEVEHLLHSDRHVEQDFAMLVDLIHTDRRVFDAMVKIVAHAALTIHFRHSVA